MCTSVVPLRCHVASNTPHRPHLCWTSLNEFITYGIQPKQRRQQRARAQALHIVSFALFFYNPMYFGDLLGSVSSLKRSVGHAPLSTSRAIRRRWSAVQVGNGRRVLVLRAAGLLRWHAGLLGVHALVLGLHVCGVVLLLGRRRAGGVLLGRRGACAELLLRVLLGVLWLLLLVLGVGVLVVDGRLLLGLAGDIGAHGSLRILLHWDCEEVLVNNN